MCKSLQERDETALGEWIMTVNGTREVRGQLTPPSHRLREIGSRTALEPIEELRTISAGIAIYLKKIFEQSV